MLDNNFDNIRKFAVKTDEDVWFYEKQINLFDILDFFPPDAIESPSGEGKQMIIETDLGWSFQTDIEFGKYCFRQKSKSKYGTGKWVIDSGLKAGDVICLDRLDDYRYKLYKSKGT